MGYKNLTICGKRDGFGCQLNAVYSGIVFCHKNTRYNYVHTPFFNVSHGYRENKEECKKLDDLVGIPPDIFRFGKKVHVTYRSMKQVMISPHLWYTPDTLELIRGYYWSNKSFERKEQIAIHIRRGDVTPSHKQARCRYQGNYVYCRAIPRLIAHYNYSKPVKIYSEGNPQDFETIFSGWDSKTRDLVELKLGVFHNPVAGCGVAETFHDMVCSEVLLQSRSAFSWCAALLNENTVLWEGGKSGSRQMGCKVPLTHWTHYAL